MTAERVVVARSEIRRILEQASEIETIVRRILERPEPRPVEHDDQGWPKLGTDWERHDDPEQQP